VKEEFVKNYLGEEGLAWAKDWYLYALKPEWEYVIFIVRRAYLMAQIMEDVTGESMEKSAAFFLTDAAFFSYYKRLAQFYVTHHRLPNILICEDSVVHGRNIQNFIDGISKAIWDSVQELSTQETDEEEFQNEFIRAVNIHVITRASTGLLLPMRYVLRIHSCTLQETRELHELSYRISSLILHSDKANAAYVFSQTITNAEYADLKKRSLQKNEFFYETRWDDVREYSQIKFVMKDQIVKSILTVRFIPNRVGNCRMIPFVFLPRLTKAETTALWKESVERIKTYIDKEALGAYEAFLQNLQAQKHKRSYDEWLTFVLSLWWMKRVEILSESNVQNSLDINDIKALARNYNFIGFDKTVAVLKSVVDAVGIMVTDEPETDPGKIIADNMNSDNYLLTVDADRLTDQELDEEKLATEIENYWIKAAEKNEGEASEAANIPHFVYDGAMSKSIKCFEEVLRKLTVGDTMKTIGYKIAYFQQLMDNGVIGIYSFDIKEAAESDYVQCVKPGEMSLVIYPARVREYLPVFSRIYQYCVYWEMDWQKVIIDFCKSPDSEIPEKDISKIEGFMNYLGESGQEPQQWDIDFEIGEMTDDEEIVKVNNELKRTVRNYHYWKRFEQYVDQ